MQKAGRAPAFNALNARAGAHNFAARPYGMPSAGSLTMTNAAGSNPGAAAQATSNLLPVGSEAPDFTLNTAPGEARSLRDLRGRPVVLVFYPADWSPVCGDQLALYNQLKDV